MTIQECYRTFGGDYADVKERLCSDALIRRFIGRFLSDDSYIMLCRAMEADDFSSDEVAKSGR